MSSPSTKAISFRARLREPPQIDRFSVAVDHVVEQHPEVRSEHAELPLHGGSGQSDLGTNSAGTRINVACDHSSLDIVGSIEVALTEELADRGHGTRSQ